MIRFLFQRLFQGLIVIVCVISITFLIIRAAPGGPFAKDRAMPAYVQENLERLYGLDQPLPVQLWRNLKSFLTLDLPVSYRLKGWNVKDIIAQAMPVSFTVGAAAFLIAIGLGVPAGAWAALRAGQIEDRVVMTLATLGICVPSLVLGPLVALVFGLKLHWFNAAGWYASSDWVLPAATLGFISASAVARLTRGGLRETLSQDYIRTARAKGLPEKLIIIRHALRLACLPLLNYLGPLAAGLLSGSFVTETIFQLPGLGRHFISSALHKDFTLAMALAAFFAVLIVVFNLLVDILQAWLNPRIRLSEK
ncbi:MAG: ABC transporter permease [Verrucomicrobiales bacterium]|nr:ABC transporter permease [Verrucomicrobiales bacterium]